ncbi:MAG: metallophosphoesterase [Saprospiraceae bacterium]
MKYIYLGVFFLFLCVVQLSGQAESIRQDSFSFIFMTDIHVQPERGAYKGFQRAVEMINERDADFVMTGGDLVYDVLRGNFERSDSLFRMYKSIVSKLNKPIYHCIGNHELFGIYEESDIDATHPDYKYGMFERHLGKTYYSFDHKGWHFIVLNSIEEKDQHYIGLIDSTQLDWLKEDLAQLAPSTPVAVALHIPLVSSFRQVYPILPDTAASQGRYIQNRAEVLQLLRDHNLKLILQGHMHWVEDINVQGQFRVITGGAIAGRPSWRRKDDQGDGRYYNEEGFMHIYVNGDNIDWKYIDIGWDAQDE